MVVGATASSGCPYRLVLIGDVMATLRAKSELSSNQRRAFVRPAQVMHREMKQSDVGRSIQPRARKRPSAEGHVWCRSGDTTSPHAPADVIGGGGRW
jgi:hypothetical protein